MSVFSEKMELYRNYFAELDQIAGRQPLAEEEVDKTALNYINAEYAKWNNIWAEDGELAGFLIICEAPDCHPDAEYFIAQLYVKPEYRKQGYAKKAVYGFVKKHPGTYCKLMVEKNAAAYAFWETVKKELHAKDVDLNILAGTAEEGEKQYGFSVKG